MIGSVIAAFNRGETSDNNLYPTQSGSMNFEGKSRCSEGISASILVWLQLWLPGNVDISPMDPRKMHLDAPSRKFVYDQMIEEWQRMDRDVPTYNTFILNRPER